MVGGVETTGMPGTAVVAGHGPGFCEAFARKLAEAGYPVGLLARSEAYIEGFAAELRAEGHDATAVPTDLVDEEAVSRGFDRLRESLGPIEAVAHTASFHEEPPGPLDPGRFEKSWRIYTQSPLLCFRAARSDLLETGGTFLCFAADPEIGGVDYKSAKAGLRGLARALATEYGPRGIQVTTVVVGGSILNPDKYERFDEVVEAEHMDPSLVADTCLHLVEQSPRCRTFELDVHAAARTYVG